MFKAKKRTLSALTVAAIVAAATLPANTLSVTSMVNTNPQSDNDNGIRTHMARRIIKDPGDGDPPSGSPVITSEERYINKYFQVDKSGATKHHIYLGDEKIGTLNNKQDLFFNIADHLGSSSIVTTATGTVAEVADYRPYGAPAFEQTFQATGNRYKFTGKELDPESTLQYFGARYLHNGYARFNAVDPILFEADQLGKLVSDPQALNTYAYSRNNPLNRKDPDGRFYQILTSALGIAAGGLWGAADAYHMTQYTLQRDLQRAGESSDRLMAKVGVGFVTGLTLGEATQPVMQRYAPNLMGRIEGAPLAVPVQNVSNIQPSLRTRIPNMRIEYKGSVVYRGEVNLEPTIQRIRAGQNYPYYNDGAVFRNDKNLLPKMGRGYYREYVHPTQSISEVGVQRIIVGKGGEWYYTPDHYKTFFPLNK